MTDDKMLRAKENYATLCAMLDDKEWHYNKNNEMFMIDCTANGDDLPMDISIRIESDLQIVSLISRLPLTAPDDKKLDFAVAISVINNNLIDGNFDFDIDSGKLYFRMTSSYIGSKLDKDVFSYILMFSCQIIDEYNDKLFMLAKNMLSLEDFLNREEQ